LSAALRATSRSACARDSLLSISRCSARMDLGAGGGREVRGTGGGALLRAWGGAGQAAGAARRAAWGAPSQAGAG
jgi:hypothetical protein